MIDPAAYRPRWICIVHRMIGFYSSACPSCAARRPPRE